MKWIDTSDLELWASKPAAKADLPLLISRLIRATTTKITTLNIPKGKSTNRGGWDGIVMASEANEFIPAGISLWEFGTTANAKGKADEDYDKRTADPKGFNPAESTFVFVTPQVWEGADDWVKEKIKEGKWKDIKVYNGSKLEEWLSIAPLQGYWLAKEIGRAPDDGVESAEDFWDNWKTGPKYELLPEVITAGRESECEKLANTLQGNANIITIQASSREEGIAFTIGAIMQFDTELQENILARSVVVESDGSFKVLVNNHDQLILIAKLESSNALNRAVAKGHFVILPLGPDEEFSGGEDIVLSRLNRDRFVDALAKSGVTKDDAERLSKESSRNITIMRRLEKFVFDRPEWAHPDHVREIIPALLVGKWDENKEHDKQVVSSIANEPYESYIAKLSKWKHKQGAPVYQIGSNWRISSPLDVWSHIAKYVTAADLVEFEKEFLNILRYVMPMMDLAPDQRFMASFYGKESEFSGSIREGMMQSLIMIAVYGDDFKMQITGGGQSFADRLVYKVFENADGNLWCSLDNVMPLISEASPDSFLSAVEEAIDGGEGITSSLFAEVNNGITPTSYHTGLLWGLENLAWMPEALSRVTLLLGRLTLVDPGGKLSNRPGNSLVQIYMSWHPQTYAHLDQRLQCLEVLAEKYPEVAWNLLIKLMPQTGNAVAFPTHKCRWRKFSYSQPGMSFPELSKTYTEVLNLCIRIVGIDVDKIVQLLNLSDRSGVDSTKILEYVKSNLGSINDKEYKIWAEMRRMLGQHRSHPKARWAISEAELQPYVELFDLFKPESVVEQNKWLFQDQWPILPEGGERYGDAWQKVVMDRRITGMQAIEKEIGLRELADLVTELIPYVAGDTLAHLIDSRERLAEVFHLLNGTDKSKTQVLYAALFRVYFTKGFELIKELYENISAETTDASVLSHILIPMPVNKEVWDFLETTDPEVQARYWREFEPHFGDLTNELKEQGIQKLFDSKRFLTAVYRMALHVEAISTETIYAVLEAAGTTPSDEMIRLDGYLVTRVFEELDKRGDLNNEQMARLETLYLDFLTSYGNTRKPKALHKDIATNPSSFVDYLQMIFLANNEEQREAEKEEREKKQGLDRAAYHVLDSWETIPGTDEDGNIDYNYLKEWIAEARKLAEAAGRIEVADMEIAKILACYKSNEGEAWPSDGICEIIDSINTKSLRDNFHAAIFNNRGVTSRGVFDGGQQERELSNYYEDLAKNHAFKWPVTSAILDSLAKEYVRIGKYEDREAAEIDLDH